MLRNKFIFLNSIYFIVSVIFLIYPALINGYPLVYSDSGAYIASGFDSHVPVDRPIMYAFFVRHISMATSLWFVVVMQAIIVTFTLLISFKYFFNAQKYFLFTFLTIVFLSLTTGISNYTSQIMPDIFSGIVIISIGLLLSIQNMNKYLKLVFGILILFSNMAHSSNLITATLITAIIIFIRLIFKKPLDIKARQVYLVVSLIVCSWLLIPSMNYLLGAGFKVSRAPNIFIMGRLVESGILNEYLHDKCPDSDLQLCKYKDKLPALSYHFLWDNDSPLYDEGCVDQEGHRTDCWLIKNQQYDPIIKDIFSTPKYLKRYFLFASEESWKQLYSFEIEPLAPMMEGSPVLGNIAWRYKQEYDQYTTAKQANHVIRCDQMNIIQNILIAFCVCVLFVCMLFKRIRKKITPVLRLFTLVAFLGIIFNAIICATFSMAADRFQGRIIWLLPLLVIFIIYSISRRNSNLL